VSVWDDERQRLVGPARAANERAGPAAAPEPQEVCLVTLDGLRVSAALRDEPVGACPAGSGPAPARTYP